MSDVSATIYAEERRSELLKVTKLETEVARFFKLNPFVERFEVKYCIFEACAKASVLKFYEDTKIDTFSHRVIEEAANSSMTGKVDIEAVEHFALLEIDGPACFDGFIQNAQEVMQAYSERTGGYAGGRR